MNFGYFGVFWRMFFRYAGIPLPPLADPEDNGGQNSRFLHIRFIASCTVKVILFFRLETEKATMQTELEDTKSQLESFKRY